jgi:hypothetical protein
MGFNIRILDKQRCFDALSDKGLLWLYGKSDMLTFEDQESEEIYQLFKEGKTDDEIAMKYGIKRTITDNNG